MLYAVKEVGSWISILVAFIGLVGALLAGWGGIWLKHRLERHNYQEGMSLGEYFRLAHRIYQILGRVRERLDCQRALIIRSENGGGIPRPGSQIYLTVVYESFGPPLQSCLSEFQRYPVDEEYMSLLDRVFQEEEVWFSATDMGEGFLRDYYESQGITGSYVARLFADDSRFVYLSLNFTGVPCDGPEHRAETRSVVHQLRMLLAEMKELTDS